MKRTMRKQKGKNEEVICVYAMKATACDQLWKNEDEYENGMGNENGKRTKMKMTKMMKKKKRESYELSEFHETGGYPMQRTKRKRGRKERM
jgi:hypothetical protein